MAEFMLIDECLELFRFADFNSQNTALNNIAVGKENLTKVGIAS